MKTNVVIQEGLTESGACGANFGQKGYRHQPFASIAVHRTGAQGMSLASALPPRKRTWQSIISGTLRTCRWPHPSGKPDRLVYCSARFIAVRASASPISTKAEVASGPPTTMRVGVFILFHS